jgi:hypothetical protein
MVIERRAEPLDWGALSAAFGPELAVVDVVECQWSSEYI